MSEDDIYAFPRPPEPPLPARTRRGWGWLLAGVLVFVALVAAACVGALVTLAGGLPEGAHVTVNGEEWLGGDIGLGQLLAAALGLTLAGLAVLTAVLTVVPMAVLLALGGAALGVGVVLLAVLLLAALVFSPLWVVLILLWLALRRKGPPATTMAR